MGYDQWIDLQIGNRTNVDLELKNVELWDESYCKFYKHGGSKDDEVPKSDIEGAVAPKASYSYVMASCGRDYSPTGTQGSLDIYSKGTDTKVATIKWDCPWTPGSDNSFSATSADESKVLVENTGWSKTGPLEYITVTIQGML